MSEFKKKKLNKDNIILEHHLGDLWIRENVIFQDDLDKAFDNDIEPIINNMSDITSFDWKIIYTMPYKEQIKNQSEKKYEIEEQNIHHLDIIKFDGNTLFLCADLCANPPELIIGLVKKFKGVKKLYIDCIHYSGGFIEDDDDPDSYICNYLNNPNWWVSFMLGDEYDIEDLKTIKAAIDPSIKIDLNDPELEEKIN